MIRSKRGGSPVCPFVSHMESLPELEDAAVDQHLLLFTCSLVPKALSSICSSVCVEAGANDKVVCGSVGQINGKVIQIELKYSDQSNLIRIKINVFLKVIRIEFN